MRLYAAKSSFTLKRSALIFSLVLPLCFLLGVMLVGLGARVLYPPTVVQDPVTHQVVVEPHPVVGSHDQALVALLKNEGSQVLGPAGPLVVVLILMAILAASMSTADANLHALSAVLTRDVYDRFIRPRASEKERTWFGRAVILAGTALALWLVIFGQKDPNFKPLKMIVEMQFIAMAASCQFLPVTIDVLFIHRGTRAGAVCGMLAGLVVVLFFTPLPMILFGHGLGDEVSDFASWLKRLFDIGFCGLAANTAVFVLVSLFTRKPDPKRVTEFKQLMQGED
jgi:Na+/proline symporter